MYQLCPLVTSLCWHLSHTGQVCRRASFYLLLCKGTSVFCPQIHLYYYTYSSPLSEKPSQNNSPQNESKRTVRHSVYRGLPVTGTCMVSLPPSSPSLSSHPLSCLIFRFSFRRWPSFCSLLVQHQVEWDLAPYLMDQRMLRLL